MTLDNFYDSGEVSATGWAWSTAARSTDLQEKTTPVNYGGRGLAYDSEEADRNVYTQQTPAERRATNPKLSADPDLLAGSALVAAPDPEDDDRPNQGFLWNAAIRANLGLLQSDKVHPGIAGAHLFAKTVRAAMAELSTRHTGQAVVLKELKAP